MSKQPANISAQRKSVGKGSILLEYVNKKVNIITNDGRNVVGTLLGFDQVCNVIVQNSEERVFSRNSGVQFVSLGLYVIRGDNIALVGEIDPERDAKVQWDKTKGNPLNPVVH